LLLPIEAKANISPGGEEGGIEEQSDTNWARMGELECE
jgi:hypothetical protein